MSSRRVRPDTSRPLIVSTWPFGKPSNDEALRTLDQTGAVLDAAGRRHGVAGTLLIDGETLHRYENQYFDTFDRVFAHYFEGADLPEITDDELDEVARAMLEEWLKDPKVLADAQGMAEDAAQDRLGVKAHGGLEVAAYGGEEGLVVELHARPALDLLAGRGTARIVLGSCSARRRAERDVACHIVQTIDI